MRYVDFQVFNSASAATAFPEKYGSYSTGNEPKIIVGITLNKETLETAYWTENVTGNMEAIQAEVDKQNALYNESVIAGLGGYRFHIGPALDETNPVILDGDVNVVNLSRDPNKMGVYRQVISPKEGIGSFSRRTR